MHSRTHPSHHTVHDDQNYRDTISVDKFDQKKKKKKKKKKKTTA